MIHSIESLGIEGAKSLNISLNPSKDNPDEPAFELEPHIQGRLLFIKQIKGESCPVYRNMAIKFNSLSEEYKVPLSSHETKDNISINANVVDKCWILEIDETISQGSGFIIEGGLLVTCAHVVASKDDTDKPVESCIAFRVSNKSDQYKAIVVHYDKHRDIALLKIDHNTHKFPFFRIEEKIPVKQNDKVSIYGFPDYKPASTYVGCVWTRVVNDFIASAVTYYEVDKVLYSGNSGGPVLNSNLHVVGIAAKGAVDGHKLNAFLCKSELEKVIATYSALHSDS
nr:MULTISPECIES: serine protease [unclassified Pseudomonas]